MSSYSMGNSASYTHKYKECVHATIHSKDKQIAQADKSPPKGF